MTTLLLWAYLTGLPVSSVLAWVILGAVLEPAPDGARRFGLAMLAAAVWPVALPILHDLVQRPRS